MHYITHVNNRYGVCEWVSAGVHVCNHYFIIIILQSWQKQKKVLLKSNAGYLSYVIFTRELNKDFELLNKKHTHVDCTR